ncbi:MAG TPA: class I SAM-dependent methyltransferase [Pyrinomonadaceae bacterium]|jgi:SAM-dependent methyltransferase|nr:class I SAM-dependent methyltransferase [Pyrinomonadaceae bacterium]
MDTNWWENFFHGIALDFWRAAISEEQTRAEAEFIQKQLRLAPGDKVLDAPCGNGRLAIQLARSGVKLTGVDIAAEFIAEAIGKATEIGTAVEWQQRDMRSLPWTNEFDGAFCFGNSFGYLEDDENAEFLQAVSRSLKPGARFVLDAPAIAECILPHFQPARAIELGGISVSIEHRYDHEQGRMFNDFTFSRAGVDDKRPSFQRLYTFRELTELLQAAGFEVVNAYGSLAEEPFTLGAPRLLLVAQKMN